MHNLVLVPPRSDKCPHSRSLDTDGFRHVMESLGIPVFCIDAGGCIAGWNGAAETLLGYARGEVVGRPISTLAPQREHETGAKNFRRALAGERIERYQTERLHRDGRSIPVQITAGLLVDESGAIVGVIGSVQDLRRDRAA